MLFVLTCSISRDFTPLFYNDNGREVRVQRYYIDIVGKTYSVQFIDSNDTEQHFDKGVSVQYIYLLEKIDDNYYHFQKYLCKGDLYKPVGKWAKTTKDWSKYIDTNGKVHKLFKK